ncbi:hypothetical protein MtrunA17_Chr4g0025181 [Medicago truncatula]|uniref:VQ motif protein n=1 Tax=Medicago truncatula TaxID=3880 RepID=A0A072UJ46_MEDTR|nr:protein HAIKU1 [Medicago truncatula]KEH29712.1 hypothetical protein MTR_4g049980 [Medicago truncatula]RHN60378.1 hypothetical protein MtrunA17_Chr4g0025181 [Medicago truncatula]
MENSKKHNDNLGLNKIGKNIRNGYFQQTISFGNDIISSSRHLYPDSDFYVVPQEEFKSFVQNITGKQSNQPKSQAKVTRLQKNRPPPLSIVRPPIPVQDSVPAPPPMGAYNSMSGHPVQPITGPPFVYNSENNLVESPISAFMRKFQDSMMKYDNSRGSQFQPFPHQPQVVNNLDVQYQPIIPYQEHHYPMNGSNQLVNGFHASQTNDNNQVVNGFPSTQENVSNPSMSPIATNSNFLVNNSNQLVNGFLSSQTNGPRSPTSEFLLSSPNSNMNFLSPSPSSPEYPFYLQNGILIPDPPSPLSSGIFPSFTSPKRSGFQ